MYGDQAYVLTALKSGAAGYVLKESCGAELFQAMREVVAGRRYLSPAVSEASIGSFTAMGTILQKTQTGLLDVHNKLTVRERKVLQLVVEGASSSDIGSRLKISSRRVESDRANCMRKLGLSLPEDLITLCTAAREPSEGRAEVCQEIQITNQQHRDEIEREPSAG